MWHENIYIYIYIYIQNLCNISICHINICHTYNMQHMHIYIQSLINKSICHINMCHIGLPDLRISYQYVTYEYIYIIYSKFNQYINMPHKYVSYLSARSKDILSITGIWIYIQNLINISICHMNMCHTCLPYLKISYQYVAYAHIYIYSKFNSYINMTHNYMSYLSARSKAILSR